MTLDEMKNLLLTSHDEGVDTATVYDSVLTEVASLVGRAEGAERQVEDLTNRVTELTENNIKLLDKIKYIQEDDISGKEEPETPEVTIDNLFEEE